MAQAVASQLGMVAMSLVGLVGVVRAWHARKQARRQDEATPTQDTVQDSAALMERRMASYLASRDTGG